MLYYENDAIDLRISYQKDAIFGDNVIKCWDNLINRILIFLFESLNLIKIY